MDDKLINALKVSKRLQEQEQLDEGLGKVLGGIGGAAAGLVGTVANGATFGLAGKLYNGAKKVAQAGAEWGSRLDAAAQRKKANAAANSSLASTSVDNSNTNTNTQQTQASAASNNTQQTQAASIKLNKDEIKNVKPCIDTAAIAACATYLKGQQDPQSWKQNLKNLGFPNDIVNAAVKAAVEAKKQNASQDNGAANGQS